MEKSSELGNPQQTDLAWLGAMMNGEGYVDVELVKAKAKTYHSPRCSIANTDPAIIIRCAEIYRQLGVTYWIGKIGSKGTRTCYALRCDRTSSLHNLLTNIIPWMVGEKQAKAKLVMEYLNSRIERTNGRLARNQHSSIPYNDREKEIVQNLGSWMPNEHTFSEVEMLQRCALNSVRKPEIVAEMTTTLQ